MSGQSNWGASLHQTFRLLPADRQSRSLRPFLESDSLPPNDVLAALPYDKARARNPGSKPDPKRYRDSRYVYECAGLLYEGDDNLVHVTELGNATLRWLGIISHSNRRVLARHAAYALASCQLRNSTGGGSKFAAEMEVFPFAFIWRAMLDLANKISSDELNRAIFKVKNEDDLASAVSLIREFRVAGSPVEELDDHLGEEVISGSKKNDRIIPWISLASFGWTLFPDKSGGANSEYYELDPHTLPLVREAARIRHRHRDFETKAEYVEHISHSAALPRDLR